MKPINLLLTGLGVLILAGAVQAQDEYVEPRKLRKDQTYSTHNYKHANKAATARRWEAKEGVQVQQPVSTNASLANYKQQVPNAQPVGGVTVPHTPSDDLASRNYKMQRPAPTAVTPNDDIVRKQSKRSDKNEATGN